MGKFKYNPGDKLGPYSTLFLERLGYEGNHHYRGKFKCSFCGKEFESRIGNVVSGTKKSCNCQSGGKIDLTNKIFYSSVKAIAPTEKRAKTDDSVIWKCKCLWCGDIFEASCSRLRNGSITSCGCSSGSLGERIIHRLLKEHGIPFEREYSLPNLKKNTKLYKFDFYVDNSYIIECDGQYHKTDVERQKDDGIKDAFCLSNNIPIICIPIEHLKDISFEDITLNSNFLVEP